MRGREFKEGKSSSCEFNRSAVAFAGFFMLRGSRTESVPLFTTNSYKRQSEKLNKGSPDWTHDNFICISTWVAETGAHLALFASELMLHRFEGGLEKR